MPIQHAAASARFAIALLLVASSGSWSVFADDPADGTGAAIAQADREFIQAAAVGGMAEVRMSDAAIAKATKEDLRVLAQHMVDDHRVINDRLSALAAREGWDLPQGLDATAQTKVDAVLSRKGTQFDRAYVMQMKIDHEQTIALFRKTADTTKVRALKDFIGETLPTVEHHLEMVKAQSKG